MDVLPNAPISVALSCTALWALFRFFQMISKGYKYGAHQHILVSEEYAHASCRNAYTLI